MATTDIAVIGAGSTGRGLAALARALGLRVTLFERGPMGGEAPDGGVAQAALRAAGQRAATLRDAARLGVGTGEAPVDWLALRAHLAAADAEAAPDSAAARFEAMGIEVIRAAARFAGPDRVAAAGREWTFRRALIATGSAPLVPSLEGLETVSALTPDTVHALEVRPGHLLVLGGTGPGLELAQAFARLGAAATVVSATPIAPGFDPEMAEGLARALRRDGVALMEGRMAVRAERTDAGLALVLDDGARVEGTHLLLALGRVPRLAGLDLTAAGVASEDGTLPVDGALRVSGNRRLWAGGDLGILARSMLFHLPAGAAGAPARAIRTEPALVELGAAASGEGGQALRWPLADTARAAAEGIEGGLVKLLVDRGGRLAGAGLLAPGGLEMAGMLAMGLGRPVSDLAGARLPQPALSAAIARAALEHRAPMVGHPALRWLAGLAKRLP